MYTLDMWWYDIWYTILGKSKKKLYLSQNLLFSWLSLYFTIDIHW